MNSVIEMALLKFLNQANHALELTIKLLEKKVGDGQDS